MLVELARGLRQLVYPGVCARCDALTTDPDGDFCRDCALALSADPHFACPRCAETVGEHADVVAGCARCRGERFAFDSASRLGPYDGALREAILAMKHADGERLAECVGRLWARHHADRYRGLGVNLVIPVPLHWWRRLRRGYNQSESLSAALARALGLEHRPGWVRRIRPTASQAQQSATARRTNLRGAFRASRRATLTGRSVLLIDDVMTTGSTAHETARALRDGGAVAVHVVVLARP